MIKKNYYALIDGLISGLLIFILGKYSVSIWVSLQSDFFDLVIIFLSITISAISAIYNLKYESIRNLLIGYVISFLSCICFLLIMFALYFLIGQIIPMSIMPLREVSNADGLLVLIFEGMYLVGMVCVRIIIFIIQLIAILKR